MVSELSVSVAGDIIGNGILNSKDVYNSLLAPVSTVVDEEAIHALYSVMLYICITFNY